MKRLYTVEEVAEQLKVQPATIRRWLRTGVLRGIKISRTWRIPEDALKELSN